MEHHGFTVSAITQDGLVTSLGAWPTLDEALTRVSADRAARGQQDSYVIRDTARFNEVVRLLLPSDPWHQPQPAARRRATRSRR